MPRGTRLDCPSLVSRPRDGRRSTVEGPRRGRGATDGHPSHGPSGSAPSPARSVLSTRLRSHPSTGKVPARLQTSFTPSVCHSGASVEPEPSPGDPRPGGVPRVGAVGLTQRGVFRRSQRRVVRHGCYLDPFSVPPHRRPPILPSARRTFVPGLSIALCVPRRTPRPSRRRPVPGPAPHPSYNFPGFWVGSRLYRLTF